MSDAPDPGAPPAPPADPGFEAGISASASKTWATPGNQPNDPAPAPDTPPAPPAPGKADTPPAPPAPPAAEPKPDSLFSRFTPGKPGGESQTPPPVSPPPPAEIKPPENLSKKAREDWDRLHGLYEEARKRADEYAPFKDEVEKLRPKATQFETLSTEHAEMSKRVMALDVRAHPEFAKAVLEPMKASAARIDEVLKANDIELTAEELLSMPAKSRRAKLNEIAEDLRGLDRDAFSRAATEYVGLQAKEAEAIGKAGETLAAYRKADELAHAQGVERQRQTFAEVVGSWQGGMLKPLEAPAGAPPERVQMVKDYNAALTQIQPNAERIAFGKLAPEQLAEASLKASLSDFLVGHAFPAMGREYAEMAQRLAAAETELQTIKKQRPGFAGGGSDESAPPGVSSIEESARRTWGGG